MIPYHNAYQVAVKAADRHSKIPFVEESKLIDALKITPGQIYSAGTTWDDIIGSMVRWGWLSKVKYKRKTYYVPSREN